MSENNDSSQNNSLNSVDYKELRRLAKNAIDAEQEQHRVETMLEYFRNAATPATVIALLDRIEELESIAHLPPEFWGREVIDEWSE